MVEDEGLVIEDFTTTVHDEVDKQVQDYHSYGDLKQDIFVTPGVWGGGCSLYIPVVAHSSEEKNSFSSIVKM